MFCVGQTVLYGSNGVCTIDEVTEKRIGKSKMEYYVLRPVCTNTSTLFVPTSNEKLVSKIRCVLTKDEANRILGALPAFDEWNDNKLERSDNFRVVAAYTVTAKALNAKTDRSVCLRTKPNKTASSLRRLTAGDKLQVIAVGKTWSKVMDLTTGKTGYVANDYIARV